MPIVGWVIPDWANFLIMGGALVIVGSAALGWIWYAHSHPRRKRKRRQHHRSRSSHATAAANDSAPPAVRREEPPESHGGSPSTLRS